MQKGVKDGHRERQPRHNHGNQDHRDNDNDNGDDDDDAVILLVKMMREPECRDYRHFYWKIVLSLLSHPRIALHCATRAAHNGRLV